MTIEDTLDKLAKDLANRFAVKFKNELIAALEKDGIKIEDVKTSKTKAKSTTPSYSSSGGCGTSFSGGCDSPKTYRYSYSGGCGSSTVSRGGC